MTINRVATFEKVSYHQFQQAALGCHAPLEGDRLVEVYDSLTLPRRATAGSAGYDFVSPFGFTLGPQETATVPTGIRVQIQPGWWLGLLPRSGHGFKFRAQLDNTLGVIDSDYYYADNEGHILVKLSNDSLTGKQLTISAGDGFVQGIFVPYGITTDDAAVAKRTGGFGSTDRGSGG